MKRSSFTLVVALASASPVWFVAVTAPLVTTACLVGKPGPSNVSQGQPYAPGEPTYDSFFADFFKVQKLLGEAPAREEKARSQLEHALLTTPGATSDALAASFKLELERLASSGVRTKLVVTGLDSEAAPTASLSRTGANMDAQSTLSDIEEGIVATATLLGELRDAKTQLPALEGRAQSLSARTEEVFKTAGKRKRAEVKKNLDDALALVPLMKTRDEEVSQKCFDLLRRLAEAAPASTPAGKAAKGPKKASATPPAAPKKPRPPREGAEPKAATPAAAKPAAPKPAEAAPPKKPSAPAGGEDFEP